MAPHAQLPGPRGAPHSCEEQGRCGGGWPSSAQAGTNRVWIPAWWRASGTRRDALEEAPCKTSSRAASPTSRLFEGVRGKFNFWGRALSFQEAPSTHVSRLAARGAGGRRRRGGPRRAVLAVLYTRRLRAKVEHPGSAGAVNSLGVNERGGPRAGSAKAPHLESASSPATARTKRQGWSRAIQIRSRAAAATSEEDEGLQHLDAPGCPWMPGIPGTESTTMILS